MKRCFILFICLLLSIIMISCTSLGEGSNTSSLVSENTVSPVLETAKQGKIEGCPYSVGTDIQKIYNDYNLDSNGQMKDDSSVDIQRYISVLETKDNRTRIDTGDARYYFNTDRKQDGISYIVCFDQSFGFFIGHAALNDIKETIGVAPDKEEMIFNKENQSGEVPWFYRGGSNSIYMLEYHLDPYVLSFYFENDKLTATTLYHTGLWSDSL